MKTKNYSFRIDQELSDRLTRQKINLSAVVREFLEGLAMELEKQDKVPDGIRIKMDVVRVRSCIELI